MTIRFSVNDKPVEVDVHPNKPLLWVLREDLGLTGTKFGCGIAQCGACTVHNNGTAIRSCIMPVNTVKGACITTIEGGNGPAFDAVQRAWRELDVVQCGYCQSGQIMSAAALLASNAQPTDEDINGAMQGNLCRCATYVRIRAAIHRAAEMMEA
jgi:aerobic-type carbon monoxide dehydrogenase small subunit (CoxS/CutS family)